MHHGIKRMVVTFGKFVRTGAPIDRGRLRIAFCIFGLSAITGLAGDLGKFKRIESFQYRTQEPGGVERAFILESAQPPQETDSFTQLRIRTLGEPEFVLKNEYAWWVKYNSSPNWLSHRKNVFTSQYVFGLRTKFGQVPHTLVILIGPPFGSSPGSLHVLALEGSKPPVVLLHKEKLDLVGVRESDGDGVPEIIGAPCTSQEWGDHLLTYDPLHVYTLRQGGQAELSIPLSRAYNQAHYYGWVGPDCSEDWAVVLHPPNGGKPVIMKAADAEKLQQPTPKK